MVDGGFLGEGEFGGVVGFIGEAYTEGLLYSDAERIHKILLVVILLVDCGHPLRRRPHPR